MNKQKALISLIGIAGISTLGYTLYHLYKKLTHIPLSNFIEEYFYEAQIKLQNSSDLYSKDNAVFIVNLFLDLEEELYRIYHIDLDEERYTFLNNNLTKEYEQLLLISIKLHQDYIKQATTMIEKKLNISMEKIKETYKKIPKEELKILKKTQKKYINCLPVKSKEIVKEAYLYWGKLNQEREQIAYQLFNLAVENIQYEDFSVQSFLFNKYYVKDKIYSLYHINDKYFDDLLEEHDLTNDDEVKKASLLLDNLAFQS